MQCKERRTNEETAVAPRSHSSSNTGGSHRLICSSVCCFELLPASDTSNYLVVFQQAVSLPEVCKHATLLVIWSSVFLLQQLVSARSWYKNLQ